MKKILVVDDENLFLYSLAMTLRKDGSEVTAVTHGKDALREILRGSYNICFLDIHLPDVKGLDLMITIREVSPATKIIIMTAAEIDNDQLKDIQMNAWSFIPKPFDLDEVRSLVERSLINNCDTAFNPEKSGRTRIESDNIR